MRKNPLFLYAAAALLFGACSRGANKEEFKSMEQIHKENGIPVVVRTMEPGVFASTIKYTASFRARSESTAVADISDVVRSIRIEMGNPVGKDQIVMTFSQDNPSYQQAKANFENAEAAFQRTKNLFENKGISQQAFDNAKTQFDIAKANFKARDDAVNVKAPIDGYITRLDVQVTDHVRSGDSLFTVSNLDTVEARIWVSASEIGLIKTGQPVTAEWIGRTLTGKISQVNMIMDPEKKAFLVLAEFRNPDSILTSGITADVNIQIYRNEKTLVVQRKEVVQEGDDYFAYVVSSSAAEKRKLTIGKTQGLVLEVQGGLVPGDLLISEGSRQVNQGDKIIVVREAAGASAVR